MQTHDPNKDGYLEVGEKKTEIKRSEGKINLNWTNADINFITDILRSKATVSAASFNHFIPS